MSGAQGEAENEPARTLCLRVARLSRPASSLGQPRLPHSRSLPELVHHLSIPIYELIFGYSGRWTGRSQESAGRPLEAFGFASGSDALKEASLPVRVNWSVCYTARWSRRCAQTPYGARWPLLYSAVYFNHFPAAFNNLPAFPLSSLFSILLFPIERTR